MAYLQVGVAKVGHSKQMAEVSDYLPTKRQEATNEDEALEIALVEMEWQLMNNNDDMLYYYFDNSQFARSAAIVFEVLDNEGNIVGWEIDV